jgi:hypothetical protein
MEMLVNAYCAARLLVQILPAEGGNLNIAEHI